MRNIRATWLRRSTLWMLLLIFISLISWRFEKVQREWASQQQQIELDSIALAQDKLGKDIDSYQMKYSALFAKKATLTKEEKTRVKVADADLKAIRAQMSAIERRLLATRDSKK